MEALKTNLIFIVIFLVGCIESSLPSTSMPSKIKIDISYTHSLHTQFKADTLTTNTNNVYWKFGDGYQARGTDVDHQYLSPGTYKASLHYDKDGEIFEQEVEIKLNGDSQNVSIAPQYPIAIDSDHNDPNQPFTSNDILPQPINTPISVSGILLAKNSCQAGNLCKDGDYQDRYTFHLNYGDTIKFEVIKGTINLQLNNADEIVTNESDIQSEYIIPAHMLNEGQHTLDIQLPLGTTKTQYIFHIKQNEILAEKNFQPGKVIVVWGHSNKPELIDISDPRLATLETTQGKPNLPQARSLLSQQNNVKSVSLNYYRNPFSSNTLSWPLYQQNIEQLWDPLLSRGDLPGENSTVAVLDTGIYYEHENFIGVNFHSGYDFVSDPINSGDNDGWDNNPSDPGDASLSYHGTHVAGIIAAQPSSHSGNNKGVAWRTSIMPIRVLGKNGGTSYDLIQALRYAAGLPNDSQKLPNKPADIINLSLGGTQFSVAEQATVHEVIKSGAIIVAAAGNQGSTKINFPAAYKDVIAIGATDIFGNLAAYSNTGAFIDLVAPGGHCNSEQCSTGINSLSANGRMTEYMDTRESSWKTMSGTSMASAHVSGLLAIARSYLPSLDAYELMKQLSTQSISDDMLVEGFDNQTGWGKLSSKKILNLMDTSNLDKSKVWVSKSDVYLKSNQSIILPIIIRGDIHTDQLNVFFNEIELDVTIQDNQLFITALKTFSSAQKILLKINDTELLHINIHPNLNAPLPLYAQHLYLEMSGEGIHYTGLRTISDNDTWKANTPPLVAGQIIQASSDIDYDGVYCEMGEFCAYSQHQYSVSESSFPLSSNEEDYQQEFKLNGTILGF